MPSKEQLQLVEQTAHMLFERLQVEARVTVTGNEDGSISVGVQLEEPHVFIGEGGQTLSEIQHLLRVILRKRLGNPAWILLDINDYRKSKEVYLKELANSAADEVALLHKEKELQPMSSQDRRIVHMVISQRQDVTSESVGEEPERRVVIKPKGVTTSASGEM